MCKLVCAIIVIVLALVALSHAQTEYYNPTENKADIKAYYEVIGERVTVANLTQLLSSTHKNQFSYDEARKRYLYPVVDRHEDGTLVGVYTDVILDQGRRTKFFSSNQLTKIAGLEAVAEAYNCEHVVPQSWFEKKLPMRGDMHHLFTAEDHCNSFRSNHPYGDCGSVTKTSDGCGQLSGDCFHPLHNKGVVSRATLYFLIRYCRLIHSSNLPRANLDQIVEWAKISRNDLSLWELHRNQEIFRAQGNRNPFIDFPEWIDQIDFSQCLL